MPAQSKQQQKFMGMVHALKKGEMDPSDASPELKKAADSMSGKDAKDFASTPHKGLPKKVKQEIVNKLKEYVNKMGTNTMGGDDYTSSKKGGLRDNDGYDNVDYNPEMEQEGKLPNNWMQGRVSDYHTSLRGKKKDYSGGTNFRTDNSGQEDLEEAGLKGIDNIPANKKLSQLSDNEKLTVIQSVGNIISFHVPDWAKGRYKFWQVISAGKVKKGKSLSGETQYFLQGKGPQKASPTYKSVKDLINGVDWNTMELRRESVNEAQAVSGGKVHKFITGKNLGYKGKKYSQIEFETLGVDNKNGTIRLKILAPKEIFGNEISLDFRSVRRGPYFKTDTSKVNEAAPCWDGYKQVGMKTKGGKQVPNCVKESVNESSKVDIIKDLDKAKNDLLKKVDVLIAKKKKLYSNVDIESPMTADEKKLDKDIADLFSQLNKLVLQKRSLKEYGQRLDLSYLEDEEARLDGTPEPKDAIDRTMDEAMIRKAGDIAQKLIPKDTWSRYVSFSDNNSKNREFVKNMIRDLSQSLNRFYKTHDINVRVQENENDNQNIDMVLGVLSILKQIEDKENRKKVAIDMIRKFKEDNIGFDYKEFLNLMGEYSMGSYEYNK